MMPHFPDEFKGIPSPQYTTIPDYFLDYMMAYMTESEIKVLLYIMRRTFGFKKKADAITVDQLCNGIVTKAGKRLDHGTGLKRSTVLNALKSLRDANVIFSHHTTEDDGGSGPTVYSLNIIDLQADEDDPRVVAREGVHVAGPRGLPAWTPGVRVAGPQGSMQPDPQKTEEQQTVEQHTPLSPPTGGRPSRRRRRELAEEANPERYSQGPYGVCPECRMKPHDPECPTLARERRTS